MMENTRERGNKRRLGTLPYLEMDVGLNATIPGRLLACVRLDPVLVPRN